MYKQLDTLTVVQFMLAMVPVLRHLDEIDGKITYKQLATLVGLLGENAKWQPWHRRQIGSLLFLLSKVEKTFGQDESLPYHRVINALTGKPGKGLYEHNAL